VTVLLDRDRLEAVSVLVVDDHRIFADLLSGALTAAGMQPVGIATTAAQAVAMVRDLRPDIVVMDINMPRQDGLTATRRIRELSPDTRVAIVTAHQDPEWIIRAAQAGASAFIPKNGALDEMIDVLSRIAGENMVIAPSAFSNGGAAAAPEAASPARPTLTRREQDVLDCLGRGMQAKAIARVLGISLETCRGYVKSLHTKLGVRSQLEAVIRAQELGLIGSPDRG
jgi:DNA-binding NarL/FixJ family response regulator